MDFKILHQEKLSCNSIFHELWKYMLHMCSASFSWGEEQEDSVVQGCVERHPGWSRGRKRRQGSMWNSIFCCFPKKEWVKEASSWSGLGLDDWNNFFRLWAVRVPLVSLSSSTTASWSLRAHGGGGTVMNSGLEWLHVSGEPVGLSFSICSLLERQCLPREVPPQSTKYTEHKMWLNEMLWFKWSYGPEGAIYWVGCGKEDIQMWI